MILDQVTRSQPPGQLVELSPVTMPPATLLHAIDETATAHGRTPRSILDSPAPRLRFPKSMRASKPSADLKGRTVAREEVREELAGILDLERLTSRITLGIATPRDLPFSLFAASLDRNSSRAPPDSLLVRSSA